MGVGRDTIVEEVRRLAERAAVRLGVEVVEVVFRRQGRYTLVRVDIDREGSSGVGLADCEALSRELDVLLDEADLLHDTYELQVSSPGIDRPIRSDDDVRRNRGRRVVIDTSEPVSGRRTLRGTLRGLAGEDLRLELDDGQEVVVPRAAVSRAVQDVESELRAGGRGRKGPARTPRPA